MDRILMWKKLAALFRDIYYFSQKEWALPAIYPDRV
jgi:hypothetical protein